MRQRGKQTAETTCNVSADSSFDPTTVRSAHRSDSRSPDVGCVTEIDLESLESSQAECCGLAYLGAIVSADSIRVRVWGDAYGEPGNPKALLSSDSSAHATQDVDDNRTEPPHTGKLTCV